MQGCIIIAFTFFFLTLTFIFHAADALRVQFTRQQIDALIPKHRLILIEAALAYLYSHPIDEDCTLLRGFEALAPYIHEPLVFTPRERFDILYGILDEQCSKVASGKNIDRWIRSVGHLLIHTPVYREPFDYYDDEDGDEDSVMAITSAQLFTALVTQLHCKAQIFWVLGCVYFGGGGGDGDGDGDGDGGDRSPPLSELPRLAVWLASFQSTYPYDLSFHRSLSPLPSLSSLSIETNLRMFLQIYFFGKPLIGHFPTASPVCLAVLYLGIGAGNVQIDSVVVGRANGLAFAGEHVSTAISAALELIPAAWRASRDPNHLRTLRGAQLICPRVFFNCYLHTILRDPEFIGELSVGELGQLVKALLEQPPSTILEGFLLKMLLYSGHEHLSKAICASLESLLWKGIRDPSKDSNPLGWIGIVGKLIALNLDQPFAIRLTWSLAESSRRLRIPTSQYHNLRRVLLEEAFERIRMAIRIHVHSGTFLMSTPSNLVPLVVLAWPTFFDDGMVGPEDAAWWIERLATRPDFEVIYEANLYKWLYHSSNFAQIIHGLSFRMLMRLARLHASPKRPAITWAKVRTAILTEIFGRPVAILVGVCPVELLELYLSHSKLFDTLPNATALASAVEGRGLLDRLKSSRQLPDLHGNLLYMMEVALQEAKRSKKISDFTSRLPLSLLRATLHLFQSSASLTWLKVSAHHQNDILAFPIPGLAALTLYIRPWVSNLHFVVVNIVIQLRIADIAQDLRHLLIFLQIHRNDDPLEWSLIQGPLLERQVAWSPWQRMAALSLANGQWLRIAESTRGSSPEELSQFLLDLDRTCEYERNEGQLEFLRHNTIRAKQ